MSELNRQLLTQLVQVKRHYQTVAGSMQGLPIYHSGLSIELIPHGRVIFESEDVAGEALLAGVITPWCLNALLLPLLWPLHWPRHVGAEISLTLPADRYVMLLNEQGFLTLSLMAEPQQLADMQAAEVFMRTALKLLATAEDVQPASEAQAQTASSASPSVFSQPVSRRGLLGRGA